jgi:DNA-binding response OmpR family regulator
MQHRIMVVQCAGELAGAIRDALHRQSFDVMYVVGLAKARRAVIEARPDLVLIDIAHWTKDVEEMLCEFGNLRSTRSSRNR